MKKDIIVKNKAIALISGGLDSLLAAKVIQEQGIDVEGICFVMSFASRDTEQFKNNVMVSAKDAGIKVRTVDISDEFLNILTDPEHGYGANLNPCIDCKILMLSCAKRMMDEVGASFIVTGEVLGERPMSQRKEALNMIKKGSGLEGLLLRPLSAKLLNETEPERAGIVDRKKLYDINGRSRARQFELARKYGIKKYFTPAGGCLLTDPGFSRRLDDLMKNNSMNIDDINLLKCGRHFRVDSSSKIIVGRDDKDNNCIIDRAGENDLLFYLKDKQGPVAMLRGIISENNIMKAAELCISHSKYKKESDIAVEYGIHGGEFKTVVASPMNREKIDSLRV